MAEAGRFGSKNRDHLRDDLSNGDTICDERSEPGWGLGAHCAEARTRLLAGQAGHTPIAGTELIRTLAPAAFLPALFTPTPKAAKRLRWLI
jgi:hypothetical protein